MRKETRGLYRQAYEKWDYTQFTLVVEECAELIQAVSKFWRDPSGENIANLAEEIADVRIMTEQLEATLDCSEAAMRVRRRKLRRLKKRLFKPKNFMDGFNKIDDALKGEKDENKSNTIV